MIPAVFLIILGIYLACGLVFAIPFELVGAKKIDPHAAHGSWGFRLLIIPDTGASPPPFVEKVPTFNVLVNNGRVLVHPNPNPAGTKVEPARIT